MSTTILRENALRCLRKVHTHVFHPSLGDQSIVEIKKNRIQLKFPGDEFGATEENAISGITRLAEFVSRAVVDMGREEESEGARLKQVNMTPCQSGFGLDELHITASAIREAEKCYMVLVDVKTMKGGELIRIASGSATLLLDPYDVRIREKELPTSSAAIDVSGAAPSPPSTLLIQNKGSMDKRVAQEFMLVNVRTPTPEKLGATPSNINHSQMFMRPPNQNAWVFYFNIEEKSEKDRVEKALLSGPLWFPKFNFSACEEGEMFMSSALNMKTVLRSVFVGSWINHVGIKPIQSIARTRAIDSIEMIRHALKYDAREKNTERLLSEDGKAMMKRIKEDIKVE